MKTNSHYEKIIEVMLESLKKDKNGNFKSNITKSNRKKSK